MVRLLLKLWRAEGRIKMGCTAIFWMLVGGALMMLMSHWMN